MPCPLPGLGRQSRPISSPRKEDENTPPPILTREGRGLKGGTHQLQGPTPGPLFPQTQALRLQTAPDPAASPFGSGGLRKTKATRPRPHLHTPTPRAKLPVAPDLPTPRPAKRPRRAPPEPPGKMAPAEQLRHQPWRRARPSAILAPSSRTPPKIPHSGRLGGREPRRARALSAKTVSPRPLVSSARPRGPGKRPLAGPRVLGAARGLVRPGRGSSAELRGQAARRRGRARPRRARAGHRAAPGPAWDARPAPSSRRGRPHERREEGSRDEEESRSQPPPLSPPSPLPLPRRGVHFAEKKENAIHTQKLPREKRNEGGKTEGRRLEKLIFLPRPPSLLALPAPCSRPRRAVLPLPSPAPSFPAPGGSGGRKTHSHSRTQLILNRLNQ